MEDNIETIKQILSKEHISYSTIKKASSGFTNLVFMIDDKFVIKATNDEDKARCLKKEIALYRSFNFDFVPEYVASGKMQDWKYLIISQIHGEVLYSIWHTLNENCRKEIVGQIAEILKSFHKLKTKLPRNDVIKNWQKNWESRMKIIAQHLDEMHLLTKNLESELRESLSYLKDNEYCTVYNDAHFDNFIYNEGKLYLIDFDRVLFCPKDYELLILKSMCDEPWKFANENDEKFTKQKDYAKILPYLKEFYPNLFSHEFLGKRIQLYQFDYYFEQAYEKKDAIWAKKIIKKFEMGE